MLGIRFKDQQKHCVGKEIVNNTRSTRLIRKFDRFRSVVVNTGRHIPSAPVNISEYYCHLAAIVSMLNVNAIYQYSCIISFQIKLLYLLSLILIIILSMQRILLNNYIVFYLKISIYSLLLTFEACILISIQKGLSNV